jgi:hypothetical protein
MTANAALLQQILRTTSSCWEKFANATVWRNEIERLFNASVPRATVSVVVAGLVVCFPLQKKHVTLKYTDALYQLFDDVSCGATIGSSVILDYATLAFATSFACSDTFVNRFINAEESLRFVAGNSTVASSTLKSKLLTQLRVVEYVAPHLPHIALSATQFGDVDPVVLLQSSTHTTSPQLRQQLSTIFQHYSLRYETIARLLIFLHNITTSAMSPMTASSTTTAKRKLDDDRCTSDELSLDKKRAQLSRNVLLTLANDRRCRQLLLAGRGLFPGALRDQHR